MVNPSVIIYEKDKFKGKNFLSESDLSLWKSAKVVIMMDRKNKTFDVLKHRYMSVLLKNATYEKLSEVISFRLFYK